MELPDPVMLFDENGLHARPDGIVSEVDIVPPKPLTAVRVIVDVEDEPGETVWGEVPTI